jgi:hypothetical protein
MKNYSPFKINAIVSAAVHELNEVQVELVDCFEELRTSSSGVAELEAQIDLLRARIYDLHSEYIVLRQEKKGKSGRKND